MTDETRSNETACAEARRLLREALAIVDVVGPPIAAIHICWAIDLLAKAEPTRPPSMQ